MLGLLDVLTGVSRHQALDRLIRGRTWIALVAFALIGIVTLQLLVLTLNAHIGRALAHEAQLQRENATLSIESSELAAGERVESLAARLGMELVQVGDVRFLAVDPRADIARAAAALNAPAGGSSGSASEQRTPATSPAAVAGSTSGTSEEDASASASVAEPGATAQGTTQGGAASQSSPASGEQAPSASAPEQASPAAGASASEQPAAAAAASPLEHGGATASATGEPTSGAG